MSRPVRTEKDFDEARARILEAAKKQFRRVDYALPVLVWQLYGRRNEPLTTTPQAILQIDL